MRKTLSALLFLFILASGILSEALVLLSEEEVSILFISPESKEAPVEKDVEKADKKLVFALSNYDNAQLGSTGWLPTYSMGTLYQPEYHLGVQTPPPEIG